MVVIPNIDDNHKENLMEKNILKTEILRVANFVYSSKNVEDFKQSELADICKKFGIDLDDIISQNIQKINYVTMNETEKIVKSIYDNIEKDNLKNT